MSISKKSNRWQRVFFCVFLIFSLFCFHDALAASAGTLAISAVTYTSAKGTVTYTPGNRPGPYTAYLQISTDNVNFSNKCTLSANLLEYSCTMSGLSSGVTYYVRGYYKDLGGTNYYSNTASFTTPVLISIPVLNASTTITNIAATTATGNGNVTATGNENPSSRRIQWGITSGSYTSDCEAGAGGTGSFACSMTSLSPNTTYYVRAAAYNSAGWGYGPETSFTTATTIPTVTTQPATSITATTATGNGNVTATGGANPTDRRIQWGTTSGTYTSSCPAGAGSTGAYTCSITGLSPNTTYYVRAYATNSAGTTYGSEISFTTPTLPTITITNPNTNPAQSKTLTASTNKGTLTQSITTGSTCDNSLTFTTYASTTFSTEADNGKKICYKATDASSGTSYLMSNAIAGIDTTAPTGTTSINSGAIVTNSQSVTINNTVTGATEMRFKNETGGTFSSWITYAASYAWNLLTGDGLKTLYAEFRDAAGNILSRSDTITLDTVAPTITIANPNTTFARSKTLTAETNEGTLTQVIITDTICDNTRTFTAYTSTTFTSESDNNKRICYKATDSANNTTYTLSNAITGIDTTDPSVSADNDGTNWQTTDPTITLTATDNTELSYAKYVWDTDTCTEDGIAFTNSTTITTEQGTHTLYICAQDQATNTDTWSGTYKVDTNVPMISNVSSSCENITDPIFTITAQDTTSGLDTNPYSFDGGTTWQTQNTQVYTNPTHTISENMIKVKDHAGNIATFTQPITQICINAPTVTTNAATTITPTQANLNAEISNTGGENPTRKIYWGTDQNNLTNVCNQGTGTTGTYSCNLTNLTPNTTYYYKAQATNIAGTTNGDTLSFTTQEIPAVVTITNPDADKLQSAANNEYFQINQGIHTNTQEVKTNTQVKLTTTNTEVTLPTNTTITEQNNNSFDFTQFQTANTSQAVRTQVKESLSAVKVGVPNTRMEFSQPITITLIVGHAYNGREMQVLYQEDNDTTWHSLTTCTIANGLCTFTTTHATTYTVNGDGTVSGAEQNDITTDVQDVLSMDCDQTGNTNDNIVEFNELTPGTPVTASTTCTVTTNSDAGYTLSVKRNDTDSTMDKDTDSTTDITDRTNWNSTSPNATTWQTNDTGLAFTVYATNATKNTTWWGTGTTQTDANNKYAGFPTNYTDIMQHTTYNETATTIQIGYKLDVPTTQKSGIYSGDVTYQVVTAP